MEGSNLSIDHPFFVFKNCSLFISNNNTTKKKDKKYTHTNLNEERRCFLGREDNWHASRSTELHSGLLFEKINPLAGLQQHSSSRMYNKNNTFKKKKDSGRKMGENVREILCSYVHGIGNDR